MLGRGVSELIDWACEKGESRMMIVSLPDRLLKSQLNPSAVVIYIHLANWPAALDRTVAEVARRCDFDRKTTRTALRVLQDYGFIDKYYLPAQEAA